MRYDNQATSLWRCLAVFLSLAIPMFGPASRADNESSLAAKDDKQIIACGVTLVLLEIEVRDGYLWPVSDLTYKDFVVLEDGVEQPIQSFRQKNVPETQASQGQYEIGYYPPPGDPEFKKIRVRLRDKESAKARGLRLSYSPRGYFAGIKY